MADPTPIMFLGITEAVWGKLVVMAVSVIVGWGWWVFWRVRAMSSRDDTERIHEKLHESIKGLATKVDTDAVCGLLELLSSEKGPLKTLQRSIDEQTRSIDDGTRIQEQVLTFLTRQLDEQGVVFTASDVVKGEGG